jgi:hypothetical protein
MDELKRVKAVLLVSVRGSSEHKEAKAAFVTQSTYTQSLFPEQLSAAKHSIVQAIDSLFALPPADLADDNSYNLTMDMHLSKLAHARTVWTKSKESLRLAREKAQTNLKDMSKKQRRTAAAGLKRRTADNEKLLKVYQQQKAAIVQISNRSGKAPPTEALPAKQLSKFTPAVAMAASAAKLVEMNAPLMAIRKSRVDLNKRRLLPTTTGSPEPLREWKLCDACVGSHESS